MNKKNVTIIISVLVIIAGGFWIWKNNQGVEVSQQQNQVENQEQQKKQQTEIDTSDWKTYKDEKYGFEIRYPSAGWTLAVIDEDSEYQQLGICSDDEFNENTGKRSCVGIEPNRPAYGLDIFQEFVKNRSNRLINFDFKGHNAVMLPGNDEKNWERYQNWIIKGNGDGCDAYKLIAFRVESVPNSWKTEHEQFIVNCEDERLAPIIKEIAESFKFLE